jgi:hypothetical protein
VRSRWLKAALIAGEGAVAYRKVVRPWHESWGATDEEVSEHLPGDELVEEPAVQVTRGITIEASPEHVWPWIIQIGADRGGFYSYDWLENLFRLDIHSAARIVPEWQQRAVGDLVHANAKGTGGWYVMDVRPNDALVVKMANVKASRPARRHDKGSCEFLWTFVVKEGSNGTTRLLVRERVGFGNKLTQFILAPTGFVSFFMTRKLMRGIKARAEAFCPAPAHKSRTIPDGVSRRSNSAASSRMRVHSSRVHASGGW